MVDGIAKETPRVAAIGNFDGVHRGHAFLLRATIALANDIGGDPTVVVFDPHPRRFFQPDRSPFLITNSDQRDKFLRENGVEEVIRLPFNEALAQLSPEEFVSQVLHADLKLAGVVTGSEFRFGTKRAGDARVLAALCADYGIKACAIDPYTDEITEAKKIGSSGVREAIAIGDMQGANKLLGRYWSVIGEVVEGQKLGRTIGFPTANMMLGEYVAPKEGVYAVKCYLVDRCLSGVANYGRRPTVGSDAPLLEVHLFDFEGDLYGQTIEVVFYNFIRPEQKFDGLDALKAQIMQDMVHSKEFFRGDR